MDTTRAITLILGTDDFTLVFVTYIYALLGAFFSLLLESTNRNPMSCKSPVEHSWYFLFTDNAKRILRTVLMIIVVMRFCKELLGLDLTIYSSFFIGLISDKLSGYIKQVKKNFFSGGKTYNQVGQVTGSEEVIAEEKPADEAEKTV